MYQVKCGKCGASRDVEAHNEAHASALVGQMHDPAHSGFLSATRDNDWTAHGTTKVTSITKQGVEVKVQSCLCQECQNGSEG